VVGARSRRLFALALSLAMLVGAGTPAASEAKQKPNIVVLMTDDQDAASMRMMRNTRRLIGDKGVTFRNNIATLPLCCPSRATFVTGQYPHNHGVIWNWAPEGGYTKLDHRNTLPVWLQRAGYHTAQIGKYLNEYGQKTDPHLISPGWDEWYAGIYPTTYRYYDFTFNLNGTLRHYGAPKHEYPFGTGPHNTDVLASMATRFIKGRGPRARKSCTGSRKRPRTRKQRARARKRRARCRKRRARARKRRARARKRCERRARARERRARTRKQRTRARKQRARCRKRPARPRKPFFLWLNTNAPHTTFSRYEGSPRYEGAPAVPLPRHARVFANSPLPRPPNFDEQDVSDKPQLPYTTTFPPLTQEKIDELTAQHRGRWGSLLGVDELVAKLMSTLSRTGQLKNTLFIYTSDNGWMLGEHRMAKYKYVPYEESIRVPLLMRGPGVRPGGTARGLAANIDLAPTILEAAGAKPGRVQDGISLLPMARTAPRGTEPDPVRPPRHVLIRTFPQPRGEAGALAFYAGIRTGRYKYVEWTYGITDPGTFVDGVTGAYELYDLERDPYELNSRHADPAYAPVRQALRLELKRLRNCRGASCNDTGSVP
jgi:arylsulfatase A-like enzyme